MRNWIVLSVVSALFVLNILPGIQSGSGGPGPSQLHAASSNLVVTEIMNHWPPDASKRVLITRIARTGTDTWVELYNPGPDAMVLASVSTAGETGVHASLDLTLKPGEYLYLCSFEPCGVSGSGDYGIRRVSGLSLRSTNGLSISSYPQNHPDRAGQDAVGWGNSVPALYRENHPAPGTFSVLKRQSGPNGCPKDTQDNRSDFQVVNSDQVQPKTKGKCTEGTWPVDQNEYIEVYNAGNRAVDPVRQGYEIKDSLGETENSVDEWYRIVGYPDYPHSNRTTLEPGQVGLIVRPNADTMAFSDLTVVNLRSSEMLEGTLYHRFSTGEVKLYTTQSKDGDLTFLTDGLSNRIMETLTLKRPDKLPPQKSILEQEEYWNPYETKMYEARVKNDPNGPNKNDNWTVKMWGNPGEVE